MKSLPRARVAVVVLVQGRLRDPPQELPGEDAQQRPRQVQGLEDRPPLVALVDELALVLVQELEVEEEEPEVPSQKHEVAPAEVGGVALAEMAPFLRDFELSSGSGAAERSEVDEGGGRGRELAMGSGRAPREEDKEEECVTIEEVFVRDTGAGEPARAHEYDDDVDGGEGYGRLEGSNLVLLPGPIGQLQRALKRRRERDGGLRLQRSGAGQAATTLVPAGRASEDALNLVRGMEDEQDFAGGETATKFTISPGWSITDNLGALFEVSQTDYGTEGNVTSFAFETIFTF